MGHMTHAYRVENPTTGEIEEEFDFLDSVEDVVSSASQAFRSWSSTDLADRASIIFRAADIMESRADELAALIATEMGKPLNEGVAEVKFSADILRYYAKNAATYLADEELSHEGSGTAVIRYLPLGVLVGVMPWNYPYYQVARFAAPNLMLGNTIILKHAEICPRSSASIEEILYEAGLEAGAFQNVYATHDQVAEIIADPRVQGVSLTGSERAGAAVASVAGENLKKCVLELGGSDPYILLDTDDVATAAAKAWEFRIENTGQACNANKRMIVHKDIYDEFVAELSTLADAMTPADPHNPGTNTYSPLSSLAAARNLSTQVANAVAAGATVHVGGEMTGQGAYFKPTVITDIPVGCDASYVEYFGPVAVVYKANSDEHALEIANDCPYGLGGSVHSRDVERASAVAKRINTGMTHVNVASAETVDLPFGGVKRSGFGRELGHLAFYEFANKQLFYVEK